MKRIKLTQGKFALVDNEDFEFLQKWKWCAALDKKCKDFRAMSNRHRWEKVKPVTMRMARIIMNATKGEMIDHINHNTLDNRRGNLRICTQIQNSRNSKIYKNNTTGYKGVSKCTSLTRYHKKDYFAAQIRFNKRLITLGYGTNKKSLAKLYKAASIKYFGEFAHNPTPENRSKQ